MSKQERKSLVPELRFPEFQNSDDWGEKTLNEICIINPASKELPESFIYIDLESVKAGTLLKKKKIDIIGAPSRAQRLLKSGDIIFQMVRPYQKNNYFFQREDDSEYVASTGYAQLRANESEMYLYQYLYNDRFVDRVLAKSTGSNYPAINSSDLSSLKVEIPEYSEQKKIADCLSSIDDFITDQVKKLHILKAHKKGLMQQLFPAEGKTTPKIRFAEFQCFGEWKKRTLGNFLTERNQSLSEDLPLFSLTIEDGITPKTERYERSFLVKNQEDAYKLVCPDDFAYNPMNLRFGAIARHTGTERVALSKYYNIFYCDDSVDSRFCDIYFRSYGMITHYDNVATGSLIEKRRVHFKDFLKFEIPFPTLEEQQKIADTIDSIEDLIIAQNKRIEFYKAHKKGLMQKLFPAVDEVGS